MNKIGILSKHIVLTVFNDTRPRCPMPGIIFITNDIIEDVLIIQFETPFDVLQSIYADYVLIDYSDYYISPGIIDLNVRRE